MRALLLLTVCLLGWTVKGDTQSIGVIGSSTAAGQGPSSPDSAWVNRLSKYLKDRHLIDTIYNLALGAQTTYTGMPTSYIPTGRPSPNPGANITRAISLGSNVVVVAYPSNDFVLGYSMTEYLSNLRTIYDSAVKAGKRCFITTTQPRNDVGPGIRQMFIEGKDSILAEFGPFAINFYDPVADPVTLGILPQYSTSDGIHLNDAAHALLFQAAVATNLLNIAPLAIPDSVARIRRPLDSVKKLTISKVYQTTTSLTAEISNPQSSKAIIHIISPTGITVVSQVCQLRKGTTLISLATQKLAAGAYFLKITLTDGTTITRSFARF